jgi:hypothetical protein
MVYGKYQTDSHQITDLTVIESPTGSTVEKNWAIIPDSTLKVIYSWHPMKIGEVHGTKLIFTKTYDTPTIFKHCRGSTPFISYRNYQWCVVHLVKYYIPRIYSHMLVRMDSAFQMEYSIPFSFRKNQIEYCIGFEIQKEIVTFFFSENDSTPGKITVLLSDFTFCK